MAAPKTRNWRARENAHKPEGLHLLVSGEVEVSALNKLPQLTTRTSRDPKVLELELTIVADPGEPSGDAMVWRCADYHEVVKRDQYSNVVVMWDDNVVARIPVVDDSEHGAAMQQECAALNATAAKTIKLKPAKKPAAKKAAVLKAAPAAAAPKKAAPKAAKKKTAKKAPKKTSKKTAKKKSAKKAAKKSAVSRFVKKLVKKFTPKKKPGKKKKR